MKSTNSNSLVAALSRRRLITQARLRSLNAAIRSSLARSSASIRAEMTVCLVMERVYHLYTNDSRTRLAISAHEPLIGRQPFQSDRPERVQPPRRDADLGAEAYLRSVGQLLPAGVLEERSATLRQERLRGTHTPSDDCVGVGARQRTE